MTATRPEAELFEEQRQATPGKSGIVNQGDLDTMRPSSVDPRNRGRNQRDRAIRLTTLEAIAAGHPNSRIDDVLPWNFDSLSS